MWSIEEDVICRTGKPLPPVAVADDGKAPQAAPHSASLTGILLERVILDSCALIAMNAVWHTLINWLPAIFMTQGTNLKDSIVLNTTSMSGASFDVFTAILVIDKIPRKAVGIGLPILIAVLGYIYPLQTSMLLIMLIGLFLTTFVYMRICYTPAVHVPEIWPTKAELCGSGLASAVGRISGIAAPYAVAVLLSSHGVTGVLILLGTASVITAIAIATIGIEIKGVSAEGLSIDVVANK